MTLDDIIETVTSVIAVAMFGFGTLWGIRYNPADTAVALFSLIVLCVVCYVMRDEFAKWHEQVTKNRR